MQITIPRMCIVSGPTAEKALVAQALAREGFLVTEPHGHGLPSHADPLAAAAAGRPNSGHTPGTLHPATLPFYSMKTSGIEHRDNPLTEHIGSEYEPDPDIEFLAVPCEDPDRVAALVAERGWVLRLYTAEVHHEIDEPEEKA